MNGMKRDILIGTSTGDESEKLKGAVKLSKLLYDRQYVDRSVLRRLRIWQSS